MGYETCILRGGQGGERGTVERALDQRVSILGLDASPGHDQFSKLASVRRSVAGNISIGPITKCSC